MGTATNTTAATVTLTIEEHMQDEKMNDRALVAIFTGWHRSSTENNTRGYDDAWERRERLELLGLVRSEYRGNGCWAVWLTDAGHEIIEDIDAEGDFDGHVAAIKAQSESAIPRRSAGMMY